MSAGSLPRPPDTRLTEAAFIAGTFANEAHLECARNIALRAVFALLLDLRTHDYSAVELRGGARLLEMGDPDGMALLSGVVSLQISALPELQRGDAYRDFGRFSAPTDHCAGYESDPGWFVCNGACAHVTEVTP